MSRRIVVTSGKGGVGKTTIVANLGIALANLGESVVLIDFDLGLNNLDIALGIEKNIVFDLTDVLEGKCRINQALIQCPQSENLFVLACNQAHAKNLLVSNATDVIERLCANFDWIIIDSPAGIGSNFEKSISVAKEAIVVVTPHLPSIRDSDKVINILTSAKFEKVQVAVNRIRGDMVARGSMMKADEIAKLLKTNLVGVIPESDEIGLSTSYPFHEFSSESFRIMAKNLIYDKNIQFDYISKYRGIFGMLRRSLKRRV